MGTVYPERNVVALGTKNYRHILFFLDHKHPSAYLSLDLYMENFHIFSPLLLGDGTFLTPKKRHMLEGVLHTHAHSYTVLNKYCKCSG